MIQIRPQEQFPIVYRIADPTDAATYYVRAVIRNSVTGAIIKINNLNYVNLTNDPVDTRRFSKTIQAPSDLSGQGFYIDVTVKVYTDSGYSVQSTSYLEKNDTYVIAERWSLTFGSSSMGNAGWDREKDQVDYGKIKKMIAEHWDSLPAVDLPVDRIDEVINEIKSIDIPEPKPIDLETHTRKILAAVAKEVRGISIPDITPIIERLDNFKFPDIPVPEALYPHMEALKAHFTKELSSIKGLLPKKPYTDILNDMADRITGRTVKESPLINRVKNLQS